MIWTLGGKANQFRYEGEEYAAPTAQGPDFQHDLRAIAPGRYTYYDNGNRRSNQGVVQYPAGSPALTKVTSPLPGSAYALTGATSGNALIWNRGSAPLLASFNPGPAYLSTGNSSPASTAQQLIGRFVGNSGDSVLFYTPGTTPEVLFSR